MHQMVVLEGVEPVVLRLKAGSIDRYTTAPLLRTKKNYHYSTPFSKSVNYFRDEWAGLEPAGLSVYPIFTASFTIIGQTDLPLNYIRLERDMGIEPMRQVWKTRRLPLHQSRIWCCRQESNLQRLILSQSG